MGRPARVEMPGASGAVDAAADAPASSVAAVSIESVKPDSGFRPANAPDVIPASKLADIIPPEQRTPDEPKSSKPVTKAELESTKAIATAVATAVADAMGRVEFTPIPLPGKDEKVYPYHKAILAYAAKIETPEKIFDFAYGGCKTDRGMLIEYSARELERAKAAEPEFARQLGLL